jgi:hypothetical protein
MQFFKSILSTFTIWVLAALLNASLSATWLWLFSNEYNHWPVVFALTLVFTLFFSIPGMFVFWLILLINWDKVMLFQTLLKAGAIISLLSSLFLFVLNDQELERHQFFLSLSIVISSIASIMMHFSIFNNLLSNKKPNKYASGNQ